MNYFAARQRKDGKWDYTVQNDNHIYPMGYCAEYRPFTEKDLWICGSKEQMEKENAKYSPFKDKYHTCGHNTPEEAEECYRQYLLDHADYYKKPLNDDERNQHQKCKICSAWTQNEARLHSCWEEIPLCDEHLNRESLEKVVERPGTAMSS